MGERAQNREARSRMLSAIRRHLAASAPFDRVRGEAHAQHEIETRATSAAVPDLAPVVATVDARDTAPQAVSLAEQFRAAVEAVSGSCVIVTDEAEAARAVEEIMARSVVLQNGVRRVAISDSPLVRSVMRAVRLDAEIAENVAPAGLFDCEVGITSAQWAVAETGTLVLESDRERHRLSSLVPPVHIAIVEAARIRRTLGEVLRAMGAKGKDELSRTVTFITGSSRTSDIELTLAIGVHGPAELHVIMIDDRESAGGDGA